MVDACLILYPFDRMPAYTRAWNEAVYGFVTVGNVKATRKHRVAQGDTVR